MRPAKGIARGIATGCALVAIALAAAAPGLAQAPAAQEQAPPGSPSASGAIPASERPLHDADPVLYAAARQYFPNDTAAIPARRLFRLTRDQLDATARALLPGFATKSVKETMARDPLQTNYEFADVIAFNTANIAGLSEWIAGIAARVREKPAAVIECGGGTPTPDCLKRQARAFSTKAFRGDVSAEKLDKIVAFYLSAVQAGGYAQATGDLVEVVMSSPHFLFRRELDVNAAQRLAPAQLLQAVTYTIADAPPEAVDLQSSKAEEYLRSGAEAGTTIKAIVHSRPAREKLQRFFTAWLEIKEPSEFTISPQAFPEFDAKLATAMRDETLRFLQAQLGRDNPSLKDITQSTMSFAGRTVAALPGTRSDTGGGAAANVDSSQRLGILSHPAVLASHSGPTDTRPIKRGVFWARKVMCMELEPPPKDLHAKLYEMKGATQRQRIESSTAAPACAGCHKVINPFGFMLESYDALGRWRTHDNGAPIDTSVLIDFLDEEPEKTTGSVDALRTLTNSLMFKQCFVRQLFRSYMGRREEAGDDPLLRRLFFEFASGDRQDLLRLVWMLTSSDRIVRRQ